MNPEEVVRRVMLTVVKARSIAAEHGYLDLSEAMWPRTYGTGPLSLLPVCERMLEILFSEAGVNWKGVNPDGTAWN